MLQAEVPVLVVGRLGAQVEVAVSDGLRAEGIGGNETGAVTGIQERRRLVGGVTILPVERGRPVAGTGKAGGGVEAELAEPLTPVDAAADAARVYVSDREAGADHGLLSDAIGGANTRTEVQVMGFDGTRAIAAEGT